jgi:hypothetical protein
VSSLEYSFILRFGANYMELSEQLVLVAYLKNTSSCRLTRRKMASAGAIHPIASSIEKKNSPYYLT